jgi:hypothetical protein
LSLVFRAEVFAQQEAEVSDFSWTPDGGRGGRQWVTITGYSGASRTIALPSLTSNGPIEVIGPHAFENKGLTALNLSEDVKRIEDYACAGNRLTQITMPLNATFIGEGGFKGNRLTGLTLPGGLMEIGNDAFRANQLKEVTIPVDEVSIGSGAFADNPITKIIIGSNAYLEADSFPNNFASFYASHEMASGAYTYSGGRWYAESEMGELLAAQEAARRQEEERRKRLAMQRELEQELAALARLPAQIAAEQQRQRDLKPRIDEEREQKDRLEDEVSRKRSRVNVLDSRLHTVDEDIYDDSSLSVTSRLDLIGDMKFIPQFEYKGVFDGFNIDMEGKTEYLAYRNMGEIPENEKFLYLRLTETLSRRLSEIFSVDIHNYNYINYPGYLGEIIFDSATRPPQAFHSGMVAPGLRVVYKGDLFDVTARSQIPIQYDSSISGTGFGLSTAATLHIGSVIEELSWRYSDLPLSLTASISWNTVNYSLNSGNIMDADGFNISMDLQYRGDFFIFGADWTRNGKGIDKYGVKFGFNWDWNWNENKTYIIVDLLKDEYDISEYAVTWGYSFEKWGFWVQPMYYKSGVTDSSGLGLRCALELKF